MNFNPYHQWLGLDPRLRSPHYFQLLGVSSTISDGKLFQLQVKAAAKAKLALLEQVDVKDKTEIRDQLCNRIINAEKVLSSERLRTEYIAHLKAELAAKKSKPSASEESSQPPSITTDVTLKDIPDSPPLPPLATSVPPTRAAMKSTPHQSSSFDSSIPMAIPIVRKLDSTAVPAVVRQPKTEENDLIADGPEFPLRLKPVWKKKNSRRIWVFYSSFMVLTALILAVGLYLVLERMLPSKEKTSAAAAAATSESSSSSDSISTQQEVSVPNQVLAVNASGKHAAASDLDEDGSSDGDSISAASELQQAIDEVYEKGLPLEVVSEEMIRAMPDIEARRMKVVENKVVENKVVENEPIENEPIENEPIENEPIENLPVEKATIELNQVELTELRWGLQRVRRGLQRREIDWSFQALADLDRRVEERLNSKGSTLIPSQQRLITQLDATLEAMMLVDGFWRQVRESSEKIPGGQEIKMDEQVVGFIEAQFEGVTIRNAGSNIKYEYAFMPPGIALALAEQGAISDIPTWRLQQAAFYILNNDSSEDYSKKIDELISQSVADGHDETMLREFVNADLSDVVPPADTSFPAADGREKIEAKIQSEFKYKFPDRVRPDAAANLVVKMLKSYPDEDAERGMVLMDQIRQLAIRAGDVYRVDDAIFELSQIAVIEKSSLRLDSFLELSKQKISDVATRRLMETAIPFLKTTKFSDIESDRKIELVQRLTKLAEEHGFVDSQRRLSQMQN